MRALFFCNEMLGLGHLRLSLALAGAFVARDEDATALVVTGSQAGLGIPLPPRVDILKLPALPVDPSSAWRRTRRAPPASLALPADALSALRGELALAGAEGFAPQFVVVDYKPVGRGGELRRTLESLRARPDCRLALGLWETDDARERLAAEWTATQLGD